jgi:hypothetical protein
VIPLLPIAYLPPVTYVAACVQPGKIILEKHEHYVKQSIRNRALIYGANGILPLIIPVQHNHLSEVPVHEVKIANDFPWQKIHWRSIVSAYRNSAFFEYYEDDFAAFYREKAETLFEFDLRLMNVIFQLLGVNIRPSFTSSYQKNVHDVNDLREAFHSQEQPMKDEEPSKNRYRQVFSDKHGFIPSLSILDLLFNEGAKSMDYLSADKH